MTKTALALKNSALATSDPEQRELKILDAFQSALSIAMETSDVAVKVGVIKDTRALRALAEAYSVSATTRRTIAETTIRCLRTLGLSLQELYPSVTPWQRGKEVGLDGTTCSTASRLAKHDDEALTRAFARLAKWNQIPGPHNTLKDLLDHDPEVLRRRELENARRQIRYDEEEAEREKNPDYEAIRTIERQYDFWEACKQILKLQRINAMLRKQLAEKS